MSSGTKSFFQKSNDLECRGLIYRFNRFIRSRLRKCFLNGVLLTDEPRVLRAWKRGWDVDHFIRLLRWRDEGFEPGIIYDIGAHDGGWAEMCQSVLNPRQCYLFEPQPECHARIENRQRRSRGNWHLVPVALGDRAEMHTLYVTRNRAASSLLQPAESAQACVAAIQETGRHEVRVATLDGLVECEKIPAPDLVKLDVQGFEKRVLEGGPATLAKAERMIVEVSLKRLYANQAPLAEVLQTLATWGFELDDVSEAYRLWPDIRVCQVDLWLKRTS